MTVKSTGEKRYCKKCQALKPDRAHHCSTCQRCVLKMDHHCPWLATCVGLKNYKAFLLFLVYTSLYCWLCFGLTSTWLWQEVFGDSRYDDSYAPINYVMLCVISGIIGIVLTGFTAWHLSLAYRGMTTIECLEKTRYLTPLRRSLQRRTPGNGLGREGQSYGQQLAEIHQNALPGITREEEGETILGSDDLERGRSSHRTYEELERSRERERYDDYLDEKDSEKLPNAFDLGWRRNLSHLLGIEPWLKCLPVCNTTGDGWRWEPNPKWIEARESLKQHRDQQQQGYRADNTGDHLYCENPQFGYVSDRHYVTSNGLTTEAHPRSRLHMNGYDLGSSDRRSKSGSGSGSPSSRLSLKTLRRKSSFGGRDSEDDHNNYYQISSEEDP